MKPLSCERCGGPVPLSTSESRACPWCAAPVALDEAYAAQRERLALQARLRREAEPQWAALSRAPPQGVANVSLAALLLAPSIVGMLGVSMELAAPKVIGFGILPATLPGAAGWLRRSDSRAASRASQVSAPKKSAGRKRMKKWPIGIGRL